MRILQVVNKLQYGGAEKLAIELSAALNNGRRESLICCLEEAGPMQEEARRCNVPVRSLDKQRGLDLVLIPRLASLIKREGIDVVHTHNMGPLVYGSLAARLAGVRAVVNTRHGREWKHHPAFIWGLNQAVVAISDDARGRLLASNAVPLDKVRVIHNGIDIQAFRPSSNGALRRACGLPERGVVIGTVARLAAEKDHRTLLHAFARVRAAGLGVELVIVGDGELKAELERLAVALAIQGHVTFLGFRRDVAEVLHAFDLFVLSSVTEGVSLTLLEAMASGKPVVATRVGGNPEVVVDGVTGLLVPPRDPHALAEAMTRVLADKALAERMGAAGRKRVEEHFTLTRMAEAYRRLYEDLSHH